MSPEQCAQDAEIDSRSDIYSLGVILYEMLVGHVPFSGESATIVMMKHLQEPVPSVLEERKDVAPPIARVVARAMAKVPGNRYQTVGELVEDLTIASGMIVPVPIAPAANTNIPSSSPGSVLGLSSASDDPDEVTVVRPREQYSAPEQYPSGPRRPPVTVPVHSPQGHVQAAGGFKPWKILVPSAVVLLVVFAVIYALTKDSSTTGAPNVNQPTNTLSADPNSQPVQPAQPPTGKAEQGLPSGGATNPSANVNAFPNANADEIQTPIADLSPAANTNANANGNTNSNSNANSKAPPLPEPTRSVTKPNPPGPSPSATKPPAPTPSPAQP
jgi:serine/threonine-protein kinase